MHLYLKLLILIFTSTLNTPALAKLINPWTDNPVFNSKSTPQLKSCPTPPSLSSDLKISGGIYKDKKGSLLDEKNLKKIINQTSNLRKTTQSIVTLSNVYTRTKDPKIATCVANIMENLATSNVLGGNISGYQARYTQTWLLSSFSLVWLKVKDDKTITASMKSKIELWLSNLAKSTQHYYKNNTNKNHSKKLNNMNYWAGLAVLSTGVATNNTNFYNWGLSTLRLSIQQITHEGYLETSLTRGQKSLHYHVFSLQALITMAELAYANGDNVYSQNNGALIKLIHTTVKAINDPSEIAKKAKSKQQSVKSLNPYLGFLFPYTQRTKDPITQKALTQFPSRSYLYLGGAPFPP